MSPEDLWMLAHIQLVNELGNEPSLRAIDKRMRRLRRAELKQGRKQTHTKDILDIKKKIGLFLRRVGLYNIVKKGIRPAKRLHRKHRAIRFYKHFIPEGGLCFDVGANKGMRTEVFLRLGAQVVSVEPLDINVKVLRHRFDANPNVTVVPKGLASEEGQRKIHYNETATNVSSISDEWIEVAKSLELPKDSVYGREKSEFVSVTTLDKLIEIY